MNEEIHYMPNSEEGMPPRRPLPPPSPTEKPVDLPPPTPKTANILFLADVRLQMDEEEFRDIAA